MSDRLTVLITGATAGFGAALARAYAASGDRLVLVGRRTERLEALKAELGGEVHVVTLDVRDRKAVEEAMAALPAPFDAVDVLINNAGLALGLNPAPSADLDDWDTMIDTNIKGVTYMTRAMLPGMVARDRGHIINLGSVAGTYPYPGGNVYGGTKAFVHQFSLNLRADLLGANVRVTSIEPGMADTEFSTVRFGGDKERAAKVYEGMTPMSADDIANVIHWVSKTPRHLNINVLELMPVMQAFNAFAVKRG
ncbi:MAG: NAD(P)-dependent oxidoreductase [Tistrella sp.]|jgi:3-hydroxy acid dehydrogenase/malonic semialdehyde reductase|nr:SDR family oxidoreductase [Tistrella mobilis]KYO50687.1 NAD(P)-dependent oxidoreductase [Tistrella mobilis]MBA78150.1 NAD(P)-dependent oxidoreductase [Tistrella sp.]|tara:strand:- start:2616 stop:3371 length:756 start_codon:yes stop_codon:yes gene_type:complete